MIEDTGANLWNCVNCHLNQYVMKERNYAEEKEYLLRVINPDNPFSGEVEEQKVYSKEKGTLDLEKVETPRTIFNFVKRSNRTFKGDMKEIQAEKEKTYSKILKKVNAVDPSTLISFPRSAAVISNHVAGQVIGMLALHTAPNENLMATFAQQLQDSFLTRLTQWLLH